MARIFIAIGFNDAFKQALVGVQNALKAKGVKGNYCSYRNLHLTLAFIGERYNLPEICKAVSEVAFRPFTLTLSTLGTFPTKAGVIWCGGRGVPGGYNACTPVAPAAFCPRHSV